MLAGRPPGDDDAEASDETGTAHHREASAPDVVALERELRELRDRVDEKTVDRSKLEGDLRGYVRSRVRRNHARGWGPYLVLLYGTAMTLGAFYWLRGIWALAAMFVVWFSTLGVYTFMLLVGAGVSAAGLPGRLLDRF